MAGPESVYHLLREIQTNQRMEIHVEVHSAWMVNSITADQDITVELRVEGTWIPAPAYPFAMSDLERLRISVSGQRMATVHVSMEELDTFYNQKSVGYRQVSAVPTFDVPEYVHPVEAGTGTSSTKAAVVSAMERHTVLQQNSLLEYINTWVASARKAYNWGPFDPDAPPLPADFHRGQLIGDSLVLPTLAAGAPENVERVEIVRNRDVHSLDDLRMARMVLWYTLNYDGSDLSTGNVRISPDGSLTVVNRL